MPTFRRMLAADEWKYPSGIDQANQARYSLKIFFHTQQHRIGLLV